MTKILTRISVAAVAASLAGGCGEWVIQENGAAGGAEALVTCPASPAPAVFQNALCLCEDFNDVGTGLVVSSSSGARANVGVNGRSNVVGRPTVDGTWISWGGVSGVGEISVGEDFVTTGDVQGVGRMSVGRDLVVGGDLFSVGELDVAGALRLAGTEFGIGTRSVGGMGPYSAPAAPPCGCDPETFFDVEAAVAKAREANDNAKAGLPALNVIGKQDLTLETGSYYFADVTTIGQTRIKVKGAVALHIDGNLDSVGEENIEIKQGGTLDLFVSGGIRRVGHSALGGEGGQLRLYLGGSDAVMLLVGDHALKGAVYAPEADVSFVGALAVDGALFARRLNGVGDLEIRYPAQTVPPFCDGGGGSGGGGSGGGGSGGGGSGGGGSGGGDVN